MFSLNFLKTNQKFKILLVLIVSVFFFNFFLSITTVSASTLMVGPGQTYTTIQACATVAQAGDTCFIQAGTYDERVIPAHSGTLGNSITFDGNGKAKIRGFTLTNKNYITIKGFEITNIGMSSDSNRSIYVTSTTGVQILNNNVHDTVATAILARPWSREPKTHDLLIRGNTFTNIGPNGNRAGVIDLWGDNTLVEQNDFSHAEDGIHPMGDRIVIRNNTFHDFYVAEDPSAHLDAIQSYCSGGTPNEAVNYLLIENNNYHDNPDHDEHFALINSTQNCGGSGTVILRENSIYKVGEVSYIADNNSAFGNYHKYYNNTTVTGVLGQPEHETVNLTGITNGSILNNIFVNAIQNSAPYSMYHLKSGDTTSNSDYNLAYQSTNNVNWHSPIKDEPHGLRNINPLLNGGADFHLQSSSPVIDKGGPLTTTTGSGSGTSISVADAHFFQPGWAGVAPDWIAVGATGNVAQITYINYSANTIALASSISWNVGDPVYLYKNSNGIQVLYGNAPDIGAYEYNSGSPFSTSTPPPAPTPNTSYNFGTTTLHNGSRGEAVKELQRFLNKTMNLGLVVDGKLGPKTIIVIRKWQSARGLVPDGLIGPKTKAKMNGEVK